MSTKVGGFPIEITPTLSDLGYTSGDTLFTPEELTTINRLKNTYSKVTQIGVFWDIPDAPPITLYFFHRNPEGFGDASDVPSLTFEQRIAMIGEYDVETDNYDVLPGDNSEENSYCLIAGDRIATLNSENGVGYLVATIDDDYADALADKLTITLSVEKR